MRPWLLLLVAHTAWGDASTPTAGGASGQRSPIWPSGLDSILLGVDRRGEVAFVSRAEYSLPGPSGMVPFVQCGLHVIDAAGQPIFDAWQSPILVSDGRLVHGGWRTEGRAADWFRVQPDLDCEDVVAVLRLSGRWALPTVAGPLRDDWELCGEAGADRPQGDLELHDEGDCYRLNESARLFTSPRTKAVIVGQHHFAVAPPGWHLRKRQ
jgi:hypothetical protein